jgi:hypothetical protein
MFDQHQVANQKFMWLCGSVLGVIFVLAYFLTLPAEDSVILYEYSRNLAEHGLITYGNADVPIEGATDFLWMVAIAIFHLTGLPDALSALLLNGLAAVYLVFQVKNSTKMRLLALAGMLLTPFIYSSLYGFSAMVFAACYCWCIDLLERRNPRLYLGILLLCLIRPDGVVWGVGLVGISLFQAHKGDRLPAALKALSYQLIVPGLAYFVWRAWYFSSLLPLPFYVKAAGKRDMVIAWRESVRFLSYLVIPAMATTYFASDRRAYILRTAALFAAPIVFYAVMKLEQNIGNRFLTPMFFALLILLAKEPGPKPIFIFLALVMAFSAKLTIATVFSLTNSLNENIYYIAQDMKGLHGRMLITEAGRLTYYSGWDAHDSWGLNTPAYARAPINDNTIRVQPYDLVVGHCSLDLLQAPIPAMPNPPRTWENQCKVMVSLVKAENYTVYLVPFMNTSSSFSRFAVRAASLAGLQPKEVGCARYDIYAISKKYPDRDRLGQLLLKYQAIPAAQSQLARKGGSLCT